VGNLTEECIRGWHAVSGEDDVGPFFVPADTIYAMTSEILALRRELAEARTYYSTDIARLMESNNAE